jgi:hypothetical protein
MNFDVCPPSLRRRMWSAYQKDGETEGEEERWKDKYPQQ